MKNDPFPEGKSPEVEKVVAESLKSFEDALDDDLNVSGALAAMFELIRNINKLADSRQLLADDVAPIQAALKKMDRVLGIADFPEDSISAEVEGWIEKRNAARRNKDFKKADEIRQNLLSQGIVLEDTPAGTRWKKN